VSHIELDGLDRVSVARARTLLAEAEAIDWGTATDTERALAGGKLMAAVDILLRVLGGDAA
jgi:hypothetical protein